MGQLFESGSNGADAHLAPIASGSDEVAGESSWERCWRWLFVTLSKHFSEGDASRLRRGWLRFLDALLASEIRAAGALDLHELADAAPQILRCDKDRIRVETIEEWWEFAWRRGWLERAGGRCRLTETARGDLREQREQENSPDPKLWAREIARLAVAFLAGAAGLFSRNLEVTAAILIVASVIIVGLVLVAGIRRLIERPSDRWFARLACDSLEGPPGTLRRTQSPPKRLYGPDDFESPGLAPSGFAPPHWWRHLLVTRNG
jgi:hypothetical protein